MLNLKYFMRIPISACGRRKRAEARCLCLLTLLHCRSARPLDVLPDHFGSANPYIEGNHTIAGNPFEPQPHHLFGDDRGVRYFDTAQTCYDEVSN